MSNAADYDMKDEAQTLLRAICNQSPYPLDPFPAGTSNADTVSCKTKRLHPPVSETTYTAQRLHRTKLRLAQGALARWDPRTTAASPRLGRGGHTNSRVEQGIVPLRNSAAEESGLQQKTIENTNLFEAKA